MTLVRCAVLGNPVAHSRSPAIHQAFAAQCQLGLSYERIEVALDGFEASVRALMAQGYRGVNVTLPFKTQAFALAQRVSPRAALARAANTLTLPEEEHGLIQADNTDGVGLIRDLQRLGVVMAGGDLLLLGAGGAAAGALGSLMEARPRAVWIANRDAAKAQALVASHAELAKRWGVMLRAVTLDSVWEGDAHPRLIVNATSASLQGATLPLHASAWIGKPFGYDMMYGAEPTAFMAQARAHGCDVSDGLGMLVEQAAESFFLWHGLRPETASVLQQQRASLRAVR